MHFPGRKLSSFPSKQKQLDKYRIDVIRPKYRPRKRLRLILPKKQKIYHVTLITLEGKEIHLPTMRWSKQHMNEHTKVFYGKMLEISE